MKILGEHELRQKNPLKWSYQIPSGGSALGIADIDFEGPEGIERYIAERILERYDYYLPHVGLPDAVECASSYLKSLNVKPQTIQIVPGTMVGIFASMRWLSKQKGRATIVDPIYPPIHMHATNEGIGIDWVHLDDQWRLDHDRLAEGVNSATKMIVIANPNNPTGTLYSQEDLKFIADLCEDKSLYLFSDELYAPLGKDGYTASASVVGERNLSLFGFSKAYGLAGYRAGFMHINTGSDSGLLEIVEHLLVSPSPLSSFVTTFALSDPRVERWVESFRKVCDENTAFAADLLNDAGLECVNPQSSFFVFPNLGCEDTKFVDELLHKKGTEVVAGSRFGPAGRNHIRINCATSQERLQVGIERVIEFRREHL